MNYARGWRCEYPNKVFDACQRDFWMTNIHKCWLGVQLISAVELRQKPFVARRTQQCCECLEFCLKALFHWWVGRCPTIPTYEIHMRPQWSETTVLEHLADNVWESAGGCCSLRFPLGLHTLCGFSCRHSRCFTHKILNASRNGNWIKQDSLPR